MRGALGALILTAATFSGVAVAQTAADVTAAQPVLMAAHVRVADMARSERFYTQVFGMEVSRVVNEREHVLRFPGATARAPGVILLLAREGTPPNGGFLVQVPDIEATFARVPDAGGVVERAPRETAPGIHAGFITDPDGAHIEVMQFARRGAP